MAAAFGFIFALIYIIIETNTGLLRNLIHEAFRKSILHYQLH